MTVRILQGDVLARLADRAELGRVKADVAEDRPGQGLPLFGREEAAQ